MSRTDQMRIYKECITKQLEEFHMLSSIYSAPGEMQVLDPGVISDFNEFLQHTDAASASADLRAHLEFILSIFITLDDAKKQKLDIRIELPHLYPVLEQPIVTVHTALLSKIKEKHLKLQIEAYLAELVNENETYVYQIISWLPEQIEELIKNNSNLEKEATCDDSNDAVDFERLWIYSHHIKSKTKRQEIVKLSRDLQLSGFCRSGKPGIICVEGLQENTQEFWRQVRAMQWQRITLCKSEVKHKPRAELERFRRFEGFKEQLFCDEAESAESGVMNMGLFIKYLEAHNSGYMKKELFGFE